MTAPILAPFLAPFLAPLLALAASLIFAWNTFIQRRALEDTDAATGAFLSVAATALLCWILSPFFVQAEYWRSPMLWQFAVIGLAFPAAGQWLQIRSVGAVGPSLTSSLGALTPLVSVTIGVMWLDDAVERWTALGILLMVGAVAMASWSPRGMKRGWPLWALSLPLGAALARGLAQPGLKDGLSQLPSPFFALMIGSTVSTLVLALMLLRHRARGRMRVGRGAGRFLIVGVLNGMGILSLNAALGLGALAVVSPIIATTPLWTLALSVIVFRREVLGWRHLVVAAMVVAGAVMILMR